MKKLVIAFLAVAVVISLSSAAFAAEQTGAELFKGKCAACHGPDGKGQTAMGKNLKLRDLSSEEIQKQSDSDLKATIENGKGKMPSYKGKLTDEQVGTLVQYIRSLKAK